MGGLQEVKTYMCLGKWVKDKRDVSICLRRKIKI